MPAATLSRAKAPAKSFAFYRGASFASLLVGYAGYYLCRQNLSVAMAPMEAAHLATRADLGDMASFGVLAYAAGKLTTGSLADAKGGRFAFFVGLAGAVFASLCFGVSKPLLGMFFLFWALNNYFQSMGWAGLVNVMSRWFPKKQYGTAMGFMSISYQAGAAIALAFAGVLVGWGLDWRALFLIPAGVLAVVGFAVWPFLRSSPADVGYPLPEATPAKVTEEESTYFSRLKEVLSDRKFLVMCGLSFVLTLLRKCFETWLPTYFGDLAVPAAAGAFKSTVFPILGCVGTLAAGFVSDRWLEGRRAPVMAVFLVGTAVALLGLAKLDQLALLVGRYERADLACALVGVTGFFLLGSYSLVGGVAALDFGARRTAGTAAGLLDGVGYCGAALAGRGVAEAVKGFGWSGAYGIMAVLAIAGVAICGFLWNVKPK
jgi:sugar phosphate permease